MKSYSDYVQEYNSILKKAQTDGSDYIVKPEIYIGLHFLEDNKITEPWKPEAASRLHNALQHYPQAEQSLFIKCLTAYFDMFAKE